MKVILLQKVSGLGNVDDVKEVADGYARNFLFPHHLAVQASMDRVASISAKQKKQLREAEHDLKEQQSLAGQVDGLEIEIKEKGSEQGVLYAAVPAQKIVDSLKKKGIKIEKDQLQMKPIKIFGSHAIKVKFRHGLEADITVSVVPM